MYSPERVLVTHETRELFQRSSRPMLSMCSEERDFECPGGLWRPEIRFFSLLACH